MLRYFIGGLFAAGALLFVIMLVSSTAPPGGDPRSLAQGTVAAFKFLKNPVAAPESSFVDAEGHEITLADFTGKVLLVNLWATWCGPCKTEMPTLDALQRDFGSEDFRVLAISMDRGGTEVARKFLEEAKLDNLAPYNDRLGRMLGELAKRGNFAVRGLPITLVIDRRSRVVGHLTGPAEWDTREAKDLMRYFVEESAG